MFKMKSRKGYAEANYKLILALRLELVNIKKKNRPRIFATPCGRHIDFQYGAKMTIVLPIYPVLLHLGQKCLYLCFRCLGTFWQCQNLSQAAAILDFKMAAIYFTLL